MEGGGGLMAFEDKKLMKLRGLSEKSFIEST